MANPNPQLPPDNTGKTYKTNKKMNVKAHMFQQFYLDPTSKTFWNVRGSAIRAGYSELYASNITVQEPKWWKELQHSAEYQRADMLQASQDNMQRVLKDKPQSDTKEKIQIDVSKFVSERLGKDHYSTRKELTDKGGRKLFTNETQSAGEIAVADLFIGVSSDDGNDTQD